MDFYQFFSFSARKAIYRASEICAQFNNQFLEPEHIFYSILNLRSCSAVQVMHQLNVNLPKLTYSLEAHLYEHSGEYKGSASFSARTLAMLDLAFKDAKRLHHSEIGTTHLLIALSQEPSQFLRNLFEEHNLDHKKIRDMYKWHLRGYSVAAGKKHWTVTGFDSSPAAVGGIAATMGLANFLMSRHCQKVLLNAAYLGFNSGSPHIEPVHLFLAILKQINCSAYHVLDSLKFDSEAVLVQLQESIRQTGNDVTWQRGLSEQCLELLNRAQEIQHRLRQEKLMTAHILLEMLRDPDEVLEPLFEASGVSFGEALKCFLAYLLEGDEPVSE